MARVFIALNREDVETLRDQGIVPLERTRDFQAFTSTDQWRQFQPDQDEEVLADEILQLCAAQGTGFVVVVELDDSQFNVGDEQAGRVILTDSLSRSLAVAYFLITDSAEALWFGPSELAQLLSQPKF